MMRRVSRAGVKAKKKGVWEWISQRVRRVRIGMKFRPTSMTQIRLDDPGISPQDVDMGNIAIMGEQAAKVKKLLTSAEYSGADSYGKMVATAYRMNWTDIGLSPVDMQIIESEKWDAIMLCNIYGVPPELLGLTQKTYNNVKEAEKALTTRCAFPLLTTFRDAFNHKLNTDWGFKGKNIYIDYDFSIFTELNDNMGRR